MNLRKLQTARGRVQETEPACTGHGPWTRLRTHQGHARDRDVAVEHTVGADAVPVRVQQTVAGVIAITAQVPAVERVLAVAGPDRAGFLIFAGHVNVEALA